MAGKVGDIYGISRRKAFQTVTFCVKKERNASFKKVTSILQKPEADRTEEEKEVLFSCSDLVKEVTQRIEKRKKVKDRLLEVQDPEEVLEEKCRTLADALANSRHLVVYTGAGISTSACIPDYRGTNGIWTLLQQGKDIGLHDLTQAEPTRTHMALSELHRAHILRHVVSQNCDGLHLRSGLPKFALSEVHGNMYIEVCRVCKREYWRLFDVTENTARYSHRTMRRCYECSKPLHDTIVHFGERGTLQWPLNWPGASQGADKADVILCIGSSLKVLKKYPWLWGMDKPAKKRPKLYIINLQWTPKDDHAVLKISGKCDEVMEKVMGHLKLTIPRYDRERDPIFSHATILNVLEEHTRSQPNLRHPSDVPSPPGNSDALDDSKVCASDVIVKTGSIPGDGVRTGVAPCNEIKTEPLGTIKEVENRAPSLGGVQDVKPSIQLHPVGVLEELLSNKSDVVKVEEKAECGFHFVGLGDGSADETLDSSVSQSDDPFGMETEMASGGNVTVFGDSGFAGSQAGFEHLDLSLHRPHFNADFFGTVSDPSVPVPAFCSANHSFWIDHNYSKQSIYPEHLTSMKRAASTDCEIKENSITSLNLVHGFESSGKSKGNFKESTNASSSLPSRSTRSGKSFTPMCSFCDRNHKAQYCMYYSKHEATFVTLGNCASGDTVPICECCDCDDDDEEEDEGEGETAGDASNVKEEKPDGAAGEVNKVPIVNPGWYGKGYRKRVKKKR